MKPHDMTMFVKEFESQHHVRVKVLAQTYSDILQAMRVQAGSRGSLDLIELDLAMLGEAHSYAQPLDKLCRRPRDRCFQKKRGMRRRSIGSSTLFRIG